MSSNPVITDPARVYQCPGDPYTISRSVHLGRLASFYPKCRDCVHREDTGPLSGKTVRLLQRAQARPAPGALFQEEGVQGVYLNALDRGVARALASAFAHYLAEACGGAELPCLSASHCGQARLLRLRRVVVVVGYDQRLSSPDLASGAVEGLRRSSCQVVDIGCATEACLRYAVRYLDAQGGIMVGGAAARPHVNGMRFYGRSSEPIVRGNGLEAIERQLHATAAVHGRQMGPLSYFHADVPYVASLLKYFHALRPLRVAIATRSATIRNYATRLLKDTPCIATWLADIDCRPAGAAGAAAPSNLLKRGNRRLATNQIAGENESGSAPVPRPQPAVGTADVCMIIDGAEGVEFVDQRGVAVAAEQACALLGGGALRIHPGTTLVFDEGASDTLIGLMRSLGGNVVRCSSGRREMWSAMMEHEAAFGASSLSADSGAGVHYWYSDGGPVVDPLRALAGMMAALSLSDLPLSAILDRHAGGLVATEMSVS